MHIGTLFLSCLLFIFFCSTKGEGLKLTTRSSARKSFNYAHSINVITLEKEALVSGTRIENAEGEESAFLGYTSRGVSIVLSDRPLRVVLFGFWLDELQTVSFTTTENCSATHLIYEQVDFTIQTDKRVVVATQFPEAPVGEHYRLCIKSRSRHSDAPLEFLQVSEFRTRISTEVPPRQYYFALWIQVSIISCLLILSGLFSGLNLGLMSLTPQELMLIQKSGSKSERKYAEAILPVRARGNLLLCSLLIGNVCVNSGISILLDDLTSGYIALLASSAGIVVFGEIFPQSLCVKKGLAVGAYTIWITRFFMIVTFPIAFPISKILDYLLDEEVVSYDRKRLMELIKMSNEEGLVEELKIAVGAMEISDKTVKDVMTHIGFDQDSLKVVNECIQRLSRDMLQDVYMLPNTTVLNTKAVAKILQSGYTRIPVFDGDRNNVISLLFVKDLTLLDPDDNFTIQTVCGYHQHPLRFVDDDTPLRVMLEEFKKGDYHLAMVHHIVSKEDSDPAYEIVGVVTLEDIVEEILQEEIVDETDAVLDNVKRTRRRGAQARDMSCLMDNDDPFRVISVQMQLVAIQWLTTNQKAFSSDYISQSVLEKLIRQNCHHVAIPHLTDRYESKELVSHAAKIYTKQEYSEKFTLILEGRVLVTIGQDQMTFEAGPWHAFGSEMLERMISHATHELLNMGEAECAAIALPADANKQKLGFIPDYSVVVRDDCTFLQVTARSWLLAYQSTFISRKGPRPSFVDSDHPSTLKTTADSASWSSVLERSKCQVSISPQLEFIRSNGKVRSVSESEHIELLPRSGATCSSSFLSRSLLSHV